MIAAELREEALQQSASHTVDSNQQHPAHHEQHQNDSDDVAHGHSSELGQTQALSQQHDVRQHDRKLAVEPVKDLKRRHSHHRHHRKRQRSSSRSTSMSRSHRQYAGDRAELQGHDGMPAAEHEAVLQKGSFELSEGQDRWQMWQPKS